MKEQLKMLTFFTTPTLIARLKAVCKDNGVSMSEFIRHAIRIQLDRYER